MVSRAKRQPGQRTFVGFGFGPIQAGLFLKEAADSGVFGRLVVAEIDPEVVSLVRAAEGVVRINIAHPDRVEVAQIGPVEIENPGETADRERLVDAVAAAQELATAVPSVAAYCSEAPGSVHRILAAGLREKARRGGPPAVVYTAENDNRAAEQLEEAVLSSVPPAERADVSRRVRFLNTVVGKMSGVLSGAALATAPGIQTIIPWGERAILVEAFNHILISRIDFGPGQPSFERGIAVFEEKDDLLPFEEAKLYGHNAVHALAAYTGAAAGVEALCDVECRPGLLPFLRAAFLLESGEPLVRAYRGVDPLFTYDGYRRYAYDLLERMTNPYLQDRVERVGRDPGRKLGWDDRLVGTARRALRAGVVPERFGFGIALALERLRPGVLAGGAPLGDALAPLWPGANDAEARAVVEVVEHGRRRVARWTSTGRRDLESLFHRDF